jgi:hypothetical protein
MFTCYRLICGGWANVEIGLRATRWEQSGSGIGWGEQIAVGDISMIPFGVIRVVVLWCLRSSRYAG